MDPLASLASHPSPVSKLQDNETMFQVDIISGMTCDLWPVHTCAHLQAHERLSGYG